MTKAELFSNVFNYMGLLRFLFPRSLASPLTESKPKTLKDLDIVAGRENFTLKDTFAPESLDLQLPDHYRPRVSAAIWHSPHSDWQEQLTEAIDQASRNNSLQVFWRADDIGAGGWAFQALCRLFRHHGLPLAMSVVPAWLSDLRRKQLFESAPREESLWSWHQHGWRHVNWQRSGKKSEFGEERPFEKQWRDIWRGRQKMLDIFGDRLVPVFTPPWNRLSLSTTRILQELDFKGVSTAGPLPRGAKPPLTLKNLRVQIDLHTRKGKDGAADFQALLDELASLGGRKEPCGIMIHHQRMTRFAFEFLHQLAYLLKDRAQAQFLSFEELLENDHA